jgi:hypothetical protein
MPTADEQRALRLWIEAYDPAVEVQLTDGEVEVRSNRRGREQNAVKCRRTSDLHNDLNTALARLVDQIS